MHESHYTTLISEIYVFLFGGVHVYVCVCELKLCSNNIHEIQASEYSFIWGEFCQGNAIGNLFSY